MRTERTFRVECEQAPAVAFVADFANATEWDPGTQECVQSTTGPVGVGTQWANTSKLGPITTELTYTLEELTGDHIKLVGRNKSATSIDEVTIRQVNDSPAMSEVTYVSDVTFHRFAFIAEPLMRILFAKLAKETVTGLTDALRTVGSRDSGRPD